MHVQEVNSSSDNNNYTLQAKTMTKRRYFTTADNISSKLTSHVKTMRTVKVYHRNCLVHSSIFLPLLLLLIIGKLIIIDCGNGKTISTVCMMPKILLKNC